MTVEIVVVTMVVVMDAATVVIAPGHVTSVALKALTIAAMTCSTVSTLLTLTKDLLTRSHNNSSSSIKDNNSSSILMLVMALW